MIVSAEIEATVDSISYTGQMRWVEADRIWGEEKSPPTLQQLVRTVRYENGVPSKEFLEWENVPLVPHHRAEMFA